MPTKPDNELLSDLTPLPDEIETEFGDWYKYERNDLDKLDDLVLGFNQLVKHLKEKEDGCERQRNSNHA